MVLGVVDVRWSTFELGVSVVPLCPNLAMFCLGWGWNLDLTLLSNRKDSDCEMRAGDC